jgi:site-specific recombinase XerD
MASRLIANGVELSTVQLILHSELDHVDPYLEVDERKPRQAFAEVL